jgi:hypothetical protein
MATVLKAIRPDQSAKTRHAHEEVKKRRLEYGETIGKCDRNAQVFRHEPKRFAQSLLEIIDFPVDTETADARQIVQDF